MELNYFDLVVSIIILLLGLKGIFNGFFKELFGLIGIIGGIFIASRVSDSVGEYLNNLIFDFSSHTAVSFLGFLTTLALFWLLMVFVGYTFKKLSMLSGLGPIDRILGFIFGAGKFFLIVAVIAYAISNIKALKPTLDRTLKTSTLFPIMVETGSYIMKLEPTNIKNNMNDTIKKGTQAVQEKSQEIQKSIVKEKIEKIKEKIEEK